MTGDGLCHCCLAVLLGQIIHFLHKVMIVYKIPDWYDALCALVFIFSTGNVLHRLLLQCEHICVVLLLCADSGQAKHIRLPFVFFIRVVFS